MDVRSTTHPVNENNDEEKSVGVISQCHIGKVLQ